MRRVLGVLELHAIRVPRCSAAFKSGVVHVLSLICRVDVPPPVPNACQLTTMIIKVVFAWKQHIRLCIQVHAMLTTLDIVDRTRQCRAGSRLEIPVNFRAIYSPLKIEEDALALGWGGLGTTWSLSCDTSNLAPYLVCILYILQGKSLLHSGTFPLRSTLTRSKALLHIRSLLLSCVPDTCHCTTIHLPGTAL